MQAHRRHSSTHSFVVESLESRLLLSATPITFDPNGTLIKGGVGTVNGVKFIQLGGGGGAGSVFGVPTGGGHGPSMARVFATDLNNDGIVEANEITGIAISNRCKITIFGDVHGDIVTNLKGNGSLSGGSNDGSVLLDNPVGSLTVHGSVFGNVYSGHTLNNVTITGSVENLMVGTSANGMSFQFHGPETEGVALAPFVVGTQDGGGGLRNVTIGAGFDGMYAGDGGPSGNGGSIVKVNIVHDTGGGVIHAGAGGSDPTHSGGNGGIVQNVRVSNSDGITVQAGAGGDSGRDGGAGGTGGAVQNVVINALGPVSLEAGRGGSDTASSSHGGAGGMVVKANVRSTDLTATAGAGGDGSFLGGNGGSVTSFQGTISGEGNLTAGAGGNSSSSGGTGGNVKGVHLLQGAADAFIRAIVAGNGGDGSVSNGNGGSISGVNFNGDIGSFTEAYGVDSMGGLFAGRAGATVGGHGNNGAVTSVRADRIAAIVADTDPAPEAARVISGINASVIGANFNTTPDNPGVTEPAFDYNATVAPTDQYNLGDVPIDGPVIGIKISNLKVKPLFTFQTSTGTETGRLDPH